MRTGPVTRPLPRSLYLPLNLKKHYSFLDVVCGLLCGDCGLGFVFTVSFVSCFLFLVSCFLFLVSCLLFLVSGFWFLFSGFWFLVAGFWFLVSGCWFLVSISYDATHRVSTFFSLFSFLFSFLSNPIPSCLLTLVSYFYIRFQHIPLSS